MKFWSYVFSAVVLAMISSCGSRTSQDDTTTNQNTDTLSLSTEDGDKVFYDEEFYKNVDHSFFDFIYFFKSDSLFQKQRIKFPLKFQNDSMHYEIGKDKWAFDSLLLKNIYYTQFYDSEEELNENSEENKNCIVLREINTDKNKVKNYSFCKDNAQWFLKEISMIRVSDNDFISFYERFINDSVFQCKHVMNQLQFVTYDSEDDFSLIEANISIEQWNAFKPALSTNVISGFDYGDADSGTNEKIVAIVQIDTGYNIRLCFRKSGTKGWMLYKYEDLRN